MTVQLFLFLFTVGSTASSLLTEALKKTLPETSANVIALANALIVGILGTVAAYVFMGIEFTLANSICVVLMTVCIWIGSMIGYDKVLQTIAQIKR